MTPKKILIVDDEKLARDRIRRFLAKSDFSCEIREAQNGVEALDTISDFQPEIIFLDIQMPSLSGFDVLQQLPERNFQLIFQTAFDEYAIRAFEESACDYLLKPFDEERFSKALSRAIERGNETKKLDELEEKLHRDSTYLSKLAIKNGARTRIVDLADASCFVSKDHYTCVYAGDEEYVTDLSLAWLEPRLDPEKFVRAHRNNIVAINAIDSIGGTDNSEITLVSGMKVPLSRSNRAALMKFFHNGSV